MPRPSRSLDQKLIGAARATLAETGFSGLSVRAVAKRAKVNLGMFHYHFKSKDAFVRRLMQETYEDFFVTFRDAANGPGDPLRKLRRVLVAFARFARENRAFYALLARELLNGHPQAVAFVRENFPRHSSIISGLVEECRREGLVRPLPVPVLVAFAMTSMGVPTVMVATLERGGAKAVRGLPLRRFGAMMLSDQTIEARADMVLAGLRKEDRR